MLVSFFSKSRRLGKIGENRGLEAVPYQRNI